ncbi:MAG: DUF2510 domain-containing protein [Actinomycetes bacterium]|jgi:RNA polymerase subunit RPABC4/transcription elongation factor Spt4|nr:DUF2510 domain-containing protein [Actinomycetes bacterium]
MKVCYFCTYPNADARETCCFCKAKLKETDKVPRAKWYQDPYDDGQFRYWNGTQWTNEVMRDGKELLGDLNDGDLLLLGKSFWAGESVIAPSRNVDPLKRAVSVNRNASEKPSRICATCKKTIAFDDTFCPKCGAQQPELTTTELASVIAQVQTSSAQKPQDIEPNFGYAVLGFFIPVVGLVLYLIWKDDKPGPANSAGTGALVSFIFGVVIWIIYLFSVGAIVSSAFSNL